MSWFSSFAFGPSRRWMPVSDREESETTDMDELMRMAAGQYEETVNNPGTDNAGREADLHSEQDEPVFGRHPGSLTRLSSFSRATLQFSSDVPLISISEPEATRKAFCCAQTKMEFPTKRWPFVLLSIFVIKAFIGLNVGLGVYSLLFYYPDKLVIDKSVKSFSIPNHEAYRNFEAMMLARRDNSSSGKYRREAASPHNLGSRKKREALFAKEEDLLRQTNNMLQNLKQEHTGFFRKRDESGSSPFDFHTGSTVNDALQRTKRSREIDCLYEYQSIARWKMHVIYLAHGDNDTNMFTKERLKTVHAIEKKIIEHPEFHSFCLRDPYMRRDPSLENMNDCVPLNSLMTYFFPTQDTQGMIYYDGMGSNIVDIDSALKLAMNQESFYYYVDDKINKTYQKSYLLRSEVLFGAPLAGYTCVGDYRKDQDEKFKDFVVTYINLLSTSSTDKVRVLYGGNEIFDYEVSNSFWSDVRLAIISLVAIFVLMLVLSLSLYLTIIGVVIIGISFPISLFFYRVAFGINALGLLNGAAAFVIIGIGVDDVFVFINIYRQADQIKDPVKRIWYTVKTAGVATFFTSFTTAAAFAANIASSIPAVYEFGLFMSLIVSSCWVSVFVLMPPSLYLHACFLEPIEKFLFACFSCVESKKTIQDRPQPMSSHNYQHLDHQTGREYHLYQEDEDVPMLGVDVSDGASQNKVDEEGMDDDDMLLIDNPYSDGPVQTIRPTEEPSGQETLTTEDNENNVCLGLLMQKMMMFLTDNIVIRGRYIVIGIFGAILICSCFLMAQLQPATHPPQLFRPDTNIQQLLDLKANFTIIDALHCDRCSGIYKVPSRPGRTSSPQQSSTAALTSTPPADAGSELQQHSTRNIDTVSPRSPQEQGYDNKDNTDNFPVDDNFNQYVLKLANQTKFMPAKMIIMAASGLYHTWMYPRRGGNRGSQNTTSVSWQWSTKGETVLPSSPAVTSPMTTAAASLATTTLQPAQTSPPLPQRHETSAPQEQRPDNEQPNRGGNSITSQPSHMNSGPAQPPNQQWSTPNRSSSLEENYNACTGQSCNNLKDRPLMESGATVYVVFGIKGLERSQEDVGHVLDQFKGRATFDSRFAETFNLSLSDLSHLSELCRVCNLLSNQTDLVKPGSAQCVPRGLYPLHKKLSQVPDCEDLPNTLSIYQHQAPAHAEGGIDNRGRLLWLAFAFESTTSEGQAYFEAYRQYQKWEDLIKHIKKDVLSKDSPLQSMFQTSEFWTKVMMEVVAVNSAIYSLVLSMIICVLAVAVFTGHFLLLLIVVIAIIAMICCVVGVFYLLGWEMGAVEAVSLSILVGSSVDYCVHIVEGYILAGKRMSLQCMANQPAADLRKHRTSQAVRHIGVAILCSALTTIIAAVPLTQTYIQPFAKFGSILLINTTVSVVMTLTLAVALLATVSPARYRGGWKAHLIAFSVVAGVIVAAFLGLYIASTQGISIPGPSGNPLFS